MRKTAAIIMAFALILVTSLILSLILIAILGGFESAKIADTALVISLLDPAVAAVGLGMVILQLHQGDEGDERGRVIEQQQFLLEYNKAFIENEKMTQVEAALEKYDEGLIADEDLITDENRQAFVNYLVYLEGLAPLVLDGIMEFKTIDNLMAYRFYLAVNNPVIQNDQLFRWPGYYLGCFRLYRRWTDYRHKRGLEILREETSALDSWSEYGKWLAIGERADSETD